MRTTCARVAVASSRVAFSGITWVHFTPYIRRASLRDPMWPWGSTFALRVALGHKLPLLYFIKFCPRLSATRSRFVAGPALHFPA